MSTTTDGPFVIGLSGASRAGKSTLCMALAERLALDGLRVAIVQQDRYFDRQAIRSLTSDEFPHGNWEVPEAVDHAMLREDVCLIRAGRQPRRQATLLSPPAPDESSLLQRAKGLFSREAATPRTPCFDAVSDEIAPADVVLLEGFQAFHDAALVALTGLRIWLDISEDEARERRERTSPVPPGYFESAIWKEHTKYRARALADGGALVVDAEQSPEAVFATALAAVKEHLGSAARRQQLQQPAPPGLLKSLPAALDEPYLFLSAKQASTCAEHPPLAPYAPHLPAWVPQRKVAEALGHTTDGITNALASLGGKPYVWATEFENVHSFWRFAEPTLRIDGVVYTCSEQYYHAQKPTPFDDATWEAQRVDVMRRALRAKVTASAEVRQLLLATGDHPLLSIKADRVWGFDPRRGGENMLARLLEELRQELRAMS